ncbi:hypothetical protein [Azospirillum argentinense]|uniref:DUF4365 domain-containing protein n=1 Tax=Azospirillum argentinense TaxID=2970906 RepID=UPI0032DF4AFB
MSLSTQRTGQIGVNVVESIVLREWRARWQQIDSTNDDGLDGLIFLEARGEYTGQIIHVQVKCLSAPFSKKRGCFRVPIQKKKLDTNKNVWKRTVGATILVYVDRETLKAYWVNVRDTTSIGETQVFVPKSNQFDSKARGEIRRLCGTIHIDQLLPIVETKAAYFDYLTSKDHISVSSRGYYRNLKEMKLKFKDSDSLIHFTREGWKHITRSSRSPLLRLQSFQILGTIPSIISKFREIDLKVFRTRTESEIDLVYAQALVKFSFRQTAAISLVFRKRIDENGIINYSFHTIYEARRNRDVIGIR